MPFPTDTHRRVLETILAELLTTPEVTGVLLGGSLARDTARADSDLDILVVAAREVPDDAPWRSRQHPLPVDMLVRTAEQWRKRFSPDRLGDESWGYAFLDGVTLHDPDGVVARLRADAADLHARYRTPPAVKAQYAALWRHVRPKMLAVQRGNDPVEIGWAAAVMTNDLIRTVWAANDLPAPSLDLGTVQRHLDDLTIPPTVADLLREILRAPPKEALRRQLDLVDAVESHLHAP